jgi:glycosyltransferase involved in cell wall biosynthesis
VAREPSKILALEPYYGGSHRLFLDGLAGVLPGGMDLITLPARKWKWRMRLSGPWLATELGKIPDPDRYAALLCSTFVDVAALKGMMPEWARRLPIHTYFHENQFAYPVQIENERDLHFALTNVTTALASDRLAFNSAYNLETFLAGCRQLLKKAYDMHLPQVEAAVRAKSVIIHPGQDFRLIDQTGSVGGQGETPVIIWNHRWEHDKNPEQFFAVLFELEKRNIAFQLVVLGESFRNQPPVFAEARTKLKQRIIKFGYAESRREYVQWLRRGDVVLSTAGHEFFGISVIEAVRAGCRPLLPNRLSYPELFPADHLYADGELLGKLIEALGRGRLAAATAAGLTECFSWRTVGERYRNWLFGE